MTAPLTSRSARTVLRVDAAGEALLAAVLLVMAAGGLGTGSWRLPSWLGAVVLVAVAVVLLIAAAALWWLSGRADAAVLRAVATANAVTALAALVWAALGGGLGVEPRVLLAVVAVVLAGLAAAQVGLGRRR